MGACWLRHHCTYSSFFGQITPTQTSTVRPGFVVDSAQHIIEDNWAMTCSAANAVCHRNSMGVSCGVFLRNPQRNATNASTNVDPLVYCVLESRITATVLAQTPVWEPLIQGLSTILGLLTQYISNWNCYLAASTPFRLHTFIFVFKYEYDAATISIILNKMG